MRTREVEYQGKKSLLVYLLEEERNVYEAMLPYWKHEYKNVVTYYSGKKDLKTALKEIILNHAP